MHGLKYDKNGSQNDIVSKTSECFSEIGLPYEEAEIDRVHHTGKPYKNENYYQVQDMEIQAKCLPESNKDI